MIFAIFNQAFEESLWEQSFTCRQSTCTIMIFAIFDQASYESPWEQSCTCRPNWHHRNQVCTTSMYVLLYNITHSAWQSTCTIMMLCYTDDLDNITSGLCCFTNLGHKNLVPINVWYRTLFFYRSVYKYNSSQANIIDTILYFQKNRMARFSRNEPWIHYLCKLFRQYNTLKVFLYLGKRHTYMKGLAAMLR